MAKKRLKLSVDETVKSYIQSYKEKNGIHYTGDAISRICKEHEKVQKKDEESVNSITETVTKNIEALLVNVLHTIRNEINHTERNLQFLMTKNLMEIREHFGETGETNKLITTIHKEHKE